MVNAFNSPCMHREACWTTDWTKCKNAVRANFFGNRAANIWNSLPTSVVQAPSLNSFKNRLDKLWEQYMYVEDIRTIPVRTNSLTLIELDDQ